MKTRIRYEHSCDVCGAVYDDPGTAKACEEQPETKPRFGVGEQVIAYPLLAAHRVLARIVGLSLVPWNGGHVWAYELDRFTGPVEWHSPDDFSRHEEELAPMGAT